MRSLKKLDAWYSKEKKKLFEQFMRQHFILKEEYDNRYNAALAELHDQFMLALAKRKASLFFVNAGKAKKITRFNWHTLKALKPTEGAALVIKGEDINKQFMLWSKRDNSLTPPIDHMAAGWRFATSKLRDKYQHLLDTNLI